MAVCSCLMKSQAHRTGYVCQIPHRAGTSHEPRCRTSAHTSQRSWKDLSYPDLAFQILSLYISPSEIPPQDLKAIIDRSYSTFRADDVVPLTHLQDNLYLLELFHGPSYSFKDCALQFLGNLFEYFLVRKNQGKVGKGVFISGHRTVGTSANEAIARHHLTVVGATSGDVSCPTSSI